MTETITNTYCIKTHLPIRNEEGKIVVKRGTIIGQSVSEDTARKYMTEGYYSPTARRQINPCEMNAYLTQTIVREHTLPMPYYMFNKEEVA
jgi:hypothetical protein